MKTIDIRMSELIEALPGFHEAQVPIHIAGSPGIGKTSAIDQWAAGERERDDNFWYRIINGASLTLPDVIGVNMPVEFKDKNGVKRMRMASSEPFFAFDDRGRHWSECTSGKIVIDEYDKISDLDVKKLLAECKLSGHIGPHQKPDYIGIWSTGNRQEDRSGSTKWFDHDINRTMILNLKLCFEDWEGWALANGVMPITMAFAKQHENDVFGGAPPKEQGPFCTARSLCRVDSYFQTVIQREGYLPDTNINKASAAGLIGTAMAAQFFAFMKVAARIATTDQIEADPEHMPIPDGPDGKMLVAYNCAHVTTEDNVEQLAIYINRLGKVAAEFATLYFKSIVTKQPKLVRSPSVAKWAMNNATALQASR